MSTASRARQDMGQKARYDSRKAPFGVARVSPAAFVGSLAAAKASGFGWIGSRSGRDTYRLTDSRKTECRNPRAFGKSFYRYMAAPRASKPSTVTCEHRRNRTSGPSVVCRACGLHRQFHKAGKAVAA